VTRLYRRSGGRVPVHWEPEDETLGKEAVEAVTGETNHPVEVDNETAREIREEYEQLIGEPRT
jgi:hypothetical protein